MATEQFMQAGVHIGMRQQTAQMKRFVYKVRQDGLAILNVGVIEERIKTAAKFLANYQRIMAVCRKSAGQKAVAKFAELTASKAVVGRFLPGIVTNPAFPGYFEPQAIIVTDPLIDRQAVVEAVKQRIPVVALCDTFNETGAVDIIIPCNNKGRKALAMIWWTLTKEFMKERKMIQNDEEFTAKPEEFESPEETRERKPREERRSRGPMRGGARGGQRGRGRR